VGGSDEAIVVVNRPEGRSELDLVAEYFALTPGEMKADVVGGENQQAVKLVAGNPHAIVYLSLGTAAYEAGAGTPLRLDVGRSGQLHPRARLRGAAALRPCSNEGGERRSGV